VSKRRETDVFSLTHIDSIEQDIKEMKQNRTLDETHVIDCVEKVLSA